MGLPGGPGGRCDAERSQQGQHAHDVPPLVRHVEHIETGARITFV